MPKEIHNPECLVPIVKHGDGSVMIWTAITWYSADPITTLNGELQPVTTWTFQITGCILWPRSCFLTMMQIGPFTQPEVFNIGARSMEMHFNIFLVSKMAGLKYHRTTVASFRE